jgi:hypothetical protein
VAAGFSPDGPAAAGFHGAAAAHVRKRIFETDSQIQPALIKHG